MEGNRDTETERLRVRSRSARKREEEFINFIDSEWKARPSDLKHSNHCHI
jgi:hypothetical protein